jgi:hypothetical protein
MPSYNKDKLTLFARANLQIFEKTSSANSQAGAPANYRHLIWMCRAVPHRSPPQQIPDPAEILSVRVEDGRDLVRVGLVGDEEVRLVPFDLYVFALDAAGNVIPDYRGDRTGRPEESNNVRNERMDRVAPNPAQRGIRDEQDRLQPHRGGPAGSPRANLPLQGVPGAPSAETRTAGPKSSGRATIRHWFSRSWRGTDWLMRDSSVRRSEYKRAGTF